MELGDTPFNQEQYDRMDALHLSLQNLLLAMMDNTRDGRVTYLTGPQIGLAKETVIWASEVRANRMKGVTK
ncbi:MAG: hypothetical protein GX540_08955 [Clostridiales bacterium]|nr:hypothetical protein [Clostridiales bacterium]